MFLLTEDEFEPFQELHFSNAWMFREVLLRRPDLAAPVASRILGQDFKDLQLEKFRHTALVFGNDSACVVFNATCGKEAPKRAKYIYDDWAGSAFLAGIAAEQSHDFKGRVVWVISILQKPRYEKQEILSDERILKTGGDDEAIIFGRSFQFLPRTEPDPSVSEELNRLSVFMKSGEAADDLTHEIDRVMTEIKKDENLERHYMLEMCREHGIYENGLLSGYTLGKKDVFETLLDRGCLKEKYENDSQALWWSLRMPGDLHD